MTVPGPRARQWLDAALAVVALAAIWQLSRGFFTPTDFVAWGDDAEALRGCLAGAHAGTCPTLSKFPLAYLANASIVSGSEGRLAAINLMAVLLPVACLGLIAGWRTMLRGGSIYLVAVSLSPLPAFYLRSGALEVQAGVVSGIFIACLANLLFANDAVLRLPTRVLLVVSGLLLPLYKDTVVVLLGIAVVATWLTRPWWQQGGVTEKLPSRARIHALAWLVMLPVAVGLMASVTYNLYRYGSIVPAAYMSEAAATTPSLRKSLEFLLGSIMSPNGGVVVFWALPFTIASFGWSLRGLRVDRATLVIAGVAALLSCIAFARWWAPFGWDAWGDRLMIQPLLAVLVASLLGLTQATGPRIGGVRWSTALLALPALGASAYYVLVPSIDGRGNALGDSLWPGPACGQMLHRLQTDAPSMGLEFWKTDDYYRCARERMLHVPAPRF